MLEPDRVRILQRSRIRVLLLSLQATLHTLQSEEHDVDDILQLLYNHMKDLGMNLLVLEGLRDMNGKHRRET